MRLNGDHSRLYRDDAATLLFLAAEHYRAGGFPEGVAMCTAALFASDSPRAADYLSRLTTDRAVAQAASKQVTQMSEALLGRTSRLDELDPGRLPDLNEPSYRSAFPALVPSLAANALDGQRPADVARKCHAGAITLLSALEREGVGSDIAASLLANPFHRHSQVLALAGSAGQSKVLQSLNDTTRAIFTTLAAPAFEVEA